MKLSEELKWRGLVGQTTVSDLSELDKPGRTFYFGADPSRDSMTIGNLAAMILCLRFIKAGWKGIILAGGATGMAGGDPDGKDETRSKMTLEAIGHNVAGIRGQFARIFRDADVEIVNNYDWFKDINFVDFLRNIGWQFSMTQLLDREFVKNRIGEGGKGINYAEFSYMLMQGYDYLHLYRTKHAELELCAVDQFGNCACGMQLIRKLEGAQVNVFGMPLVINKSTGKKFGKSEAGAVWLEPKYTSVFKFYQFWLNVDDAGVIDYLKIYTFLDKSEIEQLEAEQRANPGARLAQHRLAEAVTELVHGRPAMESVKRVTDTLFSGANVAELNDADLAVLAQEITTVEFGEQTLIDLLLAGKLASSKSEARRLVEQNAISVNGVKVGLDYRPTAPCLLRRGKNQFMLVK